MEIIGIDILNLITVMAGLGAFLAVILVWTAATESTQMGKRLKLLEERKDVLKSGMVAAKRRASPVKRGGSMGAMRQIVNRLKLLRQENTDKIVLKLMRAGYRSNDALVVFLFFKLASPIASVAVALILLLGLNLLEGNTIGQIAGGVGTVVLGFYLPDILVKNTTDKRMASIRKALPDALDLMVICAEAGLTLDAALTRVSREMARQSQELADEFGLTSVELGFLSDRRQALQNLTERVPLPSVRSVVATLAQTEKYGTPLAHSLRVLSNEFRNERMMRAEEKAARLPAIMTVPLVLFILPMLFIILLGPAACSIADNIVGVFGG